MESQMVFISVASFFVTFFVLYFVVKAAVKAGNTAVIKELQKSNRLKVLELKKSGIDAEILRQYGGYQEEMQRLQVLRVEYGEDTFNKEKQKLDELYN